MAQFERTFTVMAGADAAFEVLADPVRLPDYVPTLRLDDSTAVEGELDVDADLEERGGAPEAGFSADRRTRHMAWGDPDGPDGQDGPYGGTLDVAPGTTSTSTVTIRLRTRDDADPAEVEGIIDQAAANIRRLVLRR